MKIYVLTHNHTEYELYFTSAAARDKYQETHPDEWVLEESEMDVAELLDMLNIYQEGVIRETMTE